MTYKCPVCGFDRMTKPAQNYHICPSCGTEFEADDFLTPRPALRAQWIDKGMPGSGRSTVKPRDWSPYHQLIIAGFGSDLTDSPRFDTDLEFRYAVNRAFSEVHISKQL